MHQSVSIGYSMGIELEWGRAKEGYYLYSRTSFKIFYKWKKEGRKKNEENIPKPPHKL